MFLRIQLEDSTGLSHSRDFLLIEKRDHDLRPLESDENGRRGFARIGTHFGLNLLIFVDVGRIFRNHMIYVVPWLCDA